MCIQSEIILNSMMPSEYGKVLPCTRRKRIWSEVVEAVDLSVTSQLAQLLVVRMHKEVKKPEGRRG